MEILKRIQLLTDAEVSDLYDRPDFTAEERELFFSLSQKEQQALSQYHNTRTRVYFIVQLGYFRAKQQFFSFNFEDAADDTHFILRVYFGRTDTGWKGGLSRDSIRTQKLPRAQIKCEWAREHRARLTLYENKAWLYRQPSFP